jgi:hypothetical protein
MANPQTTETLAQVLYGAVKVEVSSASNFSGAVDIGAVNGAKYTEEMKISTLESDNAVDRDNVTEQKGKIEFEQIQMLNEAARAIMRGTLDTITTVPASAITDATQVIAPTWVENQFYPFAYENASGAVPTIDAGGVVQSPATALTKDTDYYITKNDHGKWGIILVSNVTTDPALSITITMDYTPAASVTYETGGKSTIPYFYVRLTNTDENGKIVKWETLGKCNLSKGDEIVFKKYNADDTRIPIPVEIQVRQDITLTAGKQLMKRTVIG